jgi:signal transduction histidine kinase
MDRRIPQTGDIAQPNLTRQVETLQDGPSMSSEVPAEHHAFRQRSLVSGPTAERLANYLLAYGLLAFLLAFLVVRHHQLAETLGSNLADLAVWTLMIVVVNLFPVWLRAATFTMDMPLLLAVALLYPPEVAVLVALIASLDVRELSGQVSVTRAVFNRSQIASLVLVAGWIFHGLATGPESWPVTVLATLVATAASFILNCYWVTLYTCLRVGQPLKVALGALRDESLGEFAATYAGYCTLALVLAFLFKEVGVWPVVLFLVPTVVAQLMLARGRSLRNLAEDLRRRERLFERLSDRIVDERRDERLRIAADLHDEVLQSLIRISQLSHFLVGEVSPSTQAHQDADELTNLTRETVESLRHVVGDLQRSPLGTGGLVPTLQGLAEELQLVWRTKIVVVSAEDPPLSPSQQVAMYQMIREALLNAMKHARATQVLVTLTVEDGGTLATIGDDGCGFLLSEVDIHSAFGIGLMKERARMSESRIEVTSAPDEGTSVRIWMPEAPG